jgi:hypothetical protein
MTKAVAIYADGPWADQHEVGHKSGPVRFVTPVQVLDLTEDALTKMQAVVDGWVQCVDLTEDVSLWCNEEGKMVGLPVNPVGTSVWVHQYGETDIIVGNIVLTGGADEEGELTDITPEALEAVGLTVGDELRAALTGEPLGV